MYSSLIYSFESFYFHLIFDLIFSLLEFHSRPLRDISQFRRAPVRFLSRILIEIYFLSILELFSWLLPFRFCFRLGTSVLIFASVSALPFRFCFRFGASVPSLLPLPLPPPLPQMLPFPLLTNTLRIRILFKVKYRIRNYFIICYGLTMPLGKHVCGCKA